MLTEGQKQEVLEQEKFVTDLLRLRRRPAEQKKWWTSPGITSGLTAVLTVAVTTFATYYMQARLKSQEDLLARQDVRLNQTREAMITVYDLLATLLKGTEDRTKIASGQYDALSDPVLKAIVDETNAIDARWRRDREMTEASVYLYFGDTEVKRWKQARGDLQRYADCAEQIFVASQGKRARANACEQERLDAVSSFAALRDALIAAYLKKSATLQRERLCKQLYEAASRLPCASGSC